MIESLFSLEAMNLPPLLRQPGQQTILQFFATSTSPHYHRRRQNQLASTPDSEATADTTLPQHHYNNHYRSYYQHQRLLPIQHYTQPAFLALAFSTTFDSRAAPPELTRPYTRLPYTSRVLVGRGSKAAKKAKKAN